MFDALFPGWQNPGTIALIVGFRVLCNATLTGIAARASGLESRLTVALGGLTIVSGLLVVLALRPGGVGLYGSYLELLIQLAIVLLGAYALVTWFSIPRGLFGLVALLGAIGLALITIPIYGEAFVAP